MGSDPDHPRVAEDLLDEAQLDDAAGEVDEDETDELDLAFRTLCW